MPKGPRDADGRDRRAPPPAAPKTSPVASIEPSSDEDDAPASSDSGPALHAAAPAGAVLEREDLDVVAEAARVGAGDVGDHVVHVAAACVRAERRDRRGDVLGPALDDPVDVTSAVAGSLEHGGDVLRAERVERVGRRRARPARAATRRGSSTTVQPASAISSRSASAPAKSFAARRCARSLGEVLDLW